jgi:hypothetical protein
MEAEAILSWAVIIFKRSVHFAVMQLLLSPSAGHILKLSLFKHIGVRGVTVEVGVDYIT